MGWMTINTSVVFLMPEEKELHDKFVASHDMTEWEKRHTVTKYVKYTKEETMMLKETDNF